MKFHGETLEGPSVKTVCIPYQGKTLEFKFKSVLNYDEMDALCPEPKPPQLLGHPSGKTVNEDNPDYVQARGVWALQRFNWQFLESISATEDLEWETVKRDDPTTWGNYVDELKTFLTDAQSNVLLSAMMDVNSLSQDMMDEAEERFLADKVDKLNTVCSHLVERCFTLNGEPVKDLDSFLEEFENDGMTMGLGNDPS